MGRGAAAPHRTQHITDRERPVPVVQVDYHYLNEVGEQCTIENRFSTTLAVVDCDTAVPLQLSLP
eukprot:2154540-Lingulodinium_polyedra.AAC.1